MYLLLLLVGGLFMVVNLVVGCYVAIRLGYGPPNWQTALNLVVRLTAFQDCLNAVREWLENKSHWADRLLHRLHIPKPIIFIDTTPIISIEEDEEHIDKEAEETNGEPTEEQHEEINEGLNENSGITEEGSAEPQQ